MLPAEAPRERRGTVVILRPLALFAAVALAIGAGACGDDDGASQDDGGAQGTAELRLELDADGPGGDPPQTRTLVCGPSEPDADAAACEAALALPRDVAAPTPPNTPCTQIYGGPDELTVTGELQGEEIDAHYTRANGCEIARFDPWLPVLAEVFPGYRPGQSLAP